MRRNHLKGFVTLAFLIAILITSASYFNTSAKAAVTEWYKIAPSTCSISVDGNDMIQANLGIWGDISLDSNQTGSITVSAFCPVNIPDGATMNLLRIRTFQEGGLPANTDVTAALRRRKWDGAVYTLANANMDPSDTGDDATFSSTADTENYMYFVALTLSKTSFATVMPELEMVEIRYSI